MKKYIYCLLSVTAILLVFAACTKDKTEDNPAPEIFVDNPFINAGSDAATFTVNVTSNVDWVVKGTTDWCSATPERGQGSGVPQKLTISVAENTEYEDRSVSLFVEGGGVQYEISVTQKKMGAIIISQNSYEIEAQGDTIEVQIASNLNYKIVLPNVDWIEEWVPSRALDSQVKYYIISENTTYSPRETKIRVNEVAAGAAKSETIIISQAQNNAVILSTPTFELPAEGGNITVKVKANTDFTANILCDWIVSSDGRALTDNSLGFIVTANEDFEPREGKIVIENDVHNDTVTVLQAALVLDDITFTDRNLSQFILKTYDTNADGKIDSDEASAVTELILCTPNAYGIRTGMSISSLGGVEYLRNLEYLDMSRNSVPNIDLSANKRLKYLDCSLNKAESVIVGDSLTYLDCSHNVLENIDVTGCRDLVYLDCGENQISTLDLSANTKIETLAFYNNYKFSSIDLSANTAIKELLCYTNQITSLDLSAQKQLKLLNCAYNQLTELDLSANSELEALYCTGNKLGSLSVEGKGSLRSLSCDNNALTALKVGGCTALRTLYCWNNSLTSIDVSGLSALEFFGCAHNQLSSLNLSGCVALTGLYCQDNDLESLNVKENVALNNIYCHDNKLSSLDLSANTALTGLHAANNMFAELDLSNNTSLHTMYCTGTPTLTSIKLWDECNQDEKYFYKDETASYVGGVKGATVTATLSTGTWAAGDKIGVMTADNATGMSYMLISGEGSATAKFSGDKVSGEPVYAVYPSSVNGSLSGTDVKITFPSVVSPAMTGRYIMAGKASNEGDAIALSPISGMISLDITGNATISSIKIESTDATIVSGSATVTLGATPSVSLASSGSKSIIVNGINKTLSATATSIRIPVAPVNVVNPKITIYDNAGTGMTLQPEVSLSIKAGQTYPLSVAYVPAELETENLSNDGYANCYVVTRLGRFGFETRQVDGTLLSGAKADWVWASEESLISDISYADDQISFRASGQKGNALVALLDADGNIVWSWHIWCTDTPSDQKWNQNTWQDRNVGATSVTPDDVNTYGLLYQWGRKDPIIGANTVGSTSTVSESTAFQSDLIMPTVVNEAVVGEGNGWANIYGQSTEAKSARYPMCMYTYKAASLALNPAGSYGGQTTGQRYSGTSNNTMADWCEGANPDRWYDKTVSTSGKTLNDPCPAGYMVPTAAQHAADFIGEKYFTSANKSSVTNGRTQSVNGQTAWLPATGVRFSAYSPEGANKFIGNTAVYWNSGTGSTPSLGTFMSFTSGNVASTCGASMWKSFACPVRCVAESE